MIDISDGKAIYKVIDSLRLEKGWTIYELAKKANVSPTTIYNWRDRGSSPTLALLDSLCTELGVTVVDVFMSKDELRELTGDKKELIVLWNTLSSEQRKSIINLMKSINHEGK